MCVRVLSIVAAVAMATTQTIRAESIGPNDFANPVVLPFGDYSGFVGGPAYPDPWISQGVRIYGFASSGYVFVYPYSNNAVEVDFLTPVQRVGADILYSISTTTRLEIYDTRGAALEHVDGIGPRFLGIDAGAPLIDRARFIDLPNAWSTFPEIDNLRFEAASVPEPSSLALLSIGALAAVTCHKLNHREPRRSQDRR